MNANLVRSLVVSAFGCALAAGSTAWAGPIGVTVDFNCADGQGVKAVGGNVCTGGTGPGSATAIKSWSEGFTGTAGNGTVNVGVGGNNGSSNAVYYNPNQGDPKPALSNQAAGGSYTLTVTDSGDYLFSFVGIDLGSTKSGGSNATSYTITGYDGGTEEFVETGKICVTSGSCGPTATYTWVSSTSADLLTELVITSSDPGSVTYYDNLEVDAVAAPEPGSFLLLGTGLLALGFVAFRRYRTSGAPQLLS